MIDWHHAEQAMTLWLGGPQKRQELAGHPALMGILRDMRQAQFEAQMGRDLSGEADAITEGLLREMDGHGPQEGGDDGFSR